MSSLPAVEELCGMTNEYHYSGFGVLTQYIMITIQKIDVISISYYYVHIKVCTKRMIGWLVEGSLHK